MEIINEINYKDILIESDKKMNILDDTQNNFIKILLDKDFSNNTLCSKIFKFFYDNDLIIFDNTCGKN
jgi:hypothetical protein